VSKYQNKEQSTGKWGPIEKAHHTILSVSLRGKKSYWKVLNSSKQYPTGKVSRTIGVLLGVLKRSIVRKKW